MSAVLFDMDGTLVDSEPLMAQAYLDLVDTRGLTAEAIQHAYKGWKLDETFEDLRKTHGLDLPEDFVHAYRARTDELYRTKLTKFDGVEAVLEDLTARGRPICVASNAPLRKIHLGMACTGLDRFFGERLFSAYEVNSWKPDPGLFLAAAAALETAPEDCLVVEDSEPGVRGAQAAGMRVLLFQPDGGPDLGVPTFRDFSQFGAML